MGGRVELEEREGEKGWGGLTFERKKGKEWIKKRERDMRRVQLEAKRGKRYLKE